MNEGNEKIGKKGPRDRGRPRDASVDDRVYKAAKAILFDEGLTALSMERIARDAGIGKQTLYRRYPSRLPLLLDLVRKVGEERAPADVKPGDPPPDVRRIVETAYGFAASPGGSAVMRALLAEAANDDAAREMIFEALVRKRRALLADAIVRQKACDPKQAMVLTELIFGFMWSRLAFDASAAADDIDRVLGVLGIED